MTPQDQALALYSSGQYSEAMALARAQLPGLLDVAAGAAHALGRKDEAERYWRMILAIDPSFGSAHNNLGLLWVEQGRMAEAEVAFRQALAVRPGYAEALHNLAALLTKQRRLEEAESVCRQALAVRPGHAETYYNLGNLLKDQGRYAEAEDAFRQAMALRPGYAEAQNNLGVLAADLKRQPEAEAIYRQALAARPGNANVGFNLALLLLSMGRFEEAWPLHEWRYHPARPHRTTIPPTLPFPQWQGEPLVGQRLLVWPEQGFGDEIQFCRFVPELKAQGAGHVGWVCKTPLLPLLSTLDGLDALYPLEAGPGIGGYDYWTFPMSIPLHLGLRGVGDIPARLPYLHALPERVARWLPRLPPRPRVGLVWKGFGGHGNDAHRSLPGLELLAPLWSVPGIHFVSLQKGAGEDEARDSARPLAHLGSDIGDFADTAAIVAQLDLVICVDTAAAHLAGALGKPCWVLLPFYQTDWRWLQGREDSPWYPGVLRLFRQGQAESWADVVGRVAQALGQWQNGSGS